MNDTADIRLQRRPLGPFSVWPIGFGAMRLAGPNVFGPPHDRATAVAVLREAIDGGSTTSTRPSTTARTS
jgi:aryl-alcohol dehydrogenase-like predicted oxidoreductase